MSLGQKILTLVRSVVHTLHLVMGRGQKNLTFVWLGQLVGLENFALKNKFFNIFLFIGLGQKYLGQRQVGFLFTAGISGWVGSDQGPSLHPFTGVAF